MHLHYFKCVKETNIEKRIALLFCVTKSVAATTFYLKVQPVKDMELSSDPYEQKLYHMFKSHDKECLGTLDKTALTKLCNSLELSDDGNILIGSLMRENNSRVSFKSFKEALLNFLGTEMEKGKTEKALVLSENVYQCETPKSPEREVSPKLVMGTKKYGRRSRPQSLVSDSSLTDSDTDNTVVPIDNNKAQKVQRSSSQSEILANRRRRPNSETKLKRCASLPAQKGHRSKEQITKNQTSSGGTQLNSSVESLGNLDFENLSHTLYEIWSSYEIDLGTHYLNRAQLETVCERVGLKNISSKVAEEVFDKLKLGENDTISFTDFIGLIQSDADSVGEYGTNRKSINSTYSGHNIGSSLCTFLDSSNNIDLHAKDAINQVDTVPSQTVIEMWETINVPDAKTLLSNLGFEGDEINIPHLSKTLEYELRESTNDSQISLLKALLLVRRMEVAGLQQSLRHLIEENRKLTVDYKDANRRVVLLAQEIDERHTNLEDSTKSKIRMLEQRHAEVIRELTSQMANDREHWSALNSRLESRLKVLELEESKLKNECVILRNENSALEKEQILLQKQVTELLESNITLNNEIVELEERQKGSDGSKGENETEEVLELIDKISCLQVENANLRDKNDELVSEIENLGQELVKFKTKKNLTGRTNSDTSGEVLSDDAEQTSLGLKRRGDSPSKTRITEESPRLGKFRKCSNENSECETSGDWMALNSELNVINSSAITPTTSTSGFSQDFTSLSEVKEEEIKALKANISELENELLKYKDLKSNGEENPKSGDGKIENIEARCQELEASLEQMRKAYEDCEDYWQNKLNDERQLFEKERQIYEDEQQENDKKFTELMEKVREYEEQFSKEGRLSPIEEKDTLEQQYAELEAEAEEIRENAKTMLEEKTKEIIKLQDAIQELKCRLGDNSQFGPHLTGEVVDLESSASSPISYLWNQSTIQAPARDYQNPKWNSTQKPNQRFVNLSTSKIIIFSTLNDENVEHDDQKSAMISPIQKPVSAGKITVEDKDFEETSSNASVKSFGTHSIASTHSVHKSSIADGSTSSSPSEVKEELKKLKLFELHLKDHIQDLVQKRDSLIMELQQLQEAKPVLEKAYARAAHPSLLQRVNQLDQKNRHLQTMLRQQQQYTESIMHQSWQQQRSEVVELRNRLETQGIIMAEQTQRLANADILVKDLYVENAHLTATIQRLEQQRSRANILHQHHGLNGLPGMP